MVDKNGIYYNEFFEGQDPDSDFVEHPILSNLTKRDMMSKVKDDIWQYEAKFYFLPFLINCYKFTRKQRLPYFSIMVSPTMMFYRDRLHLRNYMDSVHQQFFKCMDMCGILHEPIMLLVEKRFHITNPIDGGTQQLYNMLWDVDLKPDRTRCHLGEMSAPTNRGVVITNTYNPPPIRELYEEKWRPHRNKYFNPDIPSDGLWLSRGTLWLQDDLNFLCKKFILDDEFVQDVNGFGYMSREMFDSTGNPLRPPPCSIYDVDDERKGEYHSTEIFDYENIPDWKIRQYMSVFTPETQNMLYDKCKKYLDDNGFVENGDTIVQVWEHIGNAAFMRMLLEITQIRLPGAREFYFKVFQPKDVEEEPEDVISSDSDLDDDDDDDFDPIDGNGMIDSTISLEQDDEEMKKILAFFANMPKVTNLVQGMLDMITGLTRILPLVADKLDKPEDKKLKDALIRIINTLNLGTDKILKICRFLGIVVDKKQSGAIGVIVKNRFKKDKKKEFLDYEIDHLNKVIDSLENVDEHDKLKHPIHPGDIPPDLTPNNLYPQRMPMHKPHIHLADNHSLEPHIDPPCDHHHHHDPVHDFLAGHEHKHDEHHHHEHHPQPPPPPPPPKEESPKKDGDDGDKKVEIPSVMPEPSNEKPDPVNGIQ